MSPVLSWLGGALGREVSARGAQRGTVLDMHDPRVLVVYREQASGRRALAAAAALELPLTVVALAPKEVRSARCGIYTPALDLAVHGAAERELTSARALLGARARSAE